MEEQEAVSGPKGKIFLSSLFDSVVIAALLAVITIFVIPFILSATSSYKSYEKSYEAYNDYLTEVSLFKKDDKGEFISTETIYKDYVVSLMYGSYFYEGREMLDKDSKPIPITKEMLFDYMNNGIYQKDQFANYYFNYRQNSDLPNEIKTKYGDRDNVYKYYYLDVLGYKDYTSYFVDNIFNDVNSPIKDQSLLKFETAEKLKLFLINEDSESEGKTIYNNLINVIDNGYICIANEQKNYSPTYNNLLNTLSADFNSTFRMRFVFIIVFYVVFTALSYLLVPLLAKSRSLGMMFFKLYPRDDNNQQINKLQVSLKWLIIILTSSFLVLFTMFLTGGFNLSILDTLSKSTLLFFAIISLVSMVINIIYFLMNKKGQFLSDRVASINYLDHEDYTE